jgi:hypothetical protein
MTLRPLSARLAIEDLINELKTEYTIVIVTHNMQQAARVSDYTGFFNIEGTGKPGRLIEITKIIFGQPMEPATEDYVAGSFVDPHAGRIGNSCFTVPTPSRVRHVLLVLGGARRSRQDEPSRILPPG